MAIISGDKNRKKSDWTIKAIKDIAPLQRGFDLPLSKIEDGPFPVVYSNGIARTHKYSMAKAPGVVTGRSGTIGTIHFIDQDYWPHNTSLWVTNFKSNDPKFIYYLFQAIGFDRFASGSGVPTLNRNDAHGFVILVPNSESEQHSIAAALSDADALISGLDQLIAKKRALKQAAMQQLLTGQRRLPGFSGEWGVKRFGDVGKCLRGVSYKGDSDLSTHDTPHTNRLLRSNNIQDAVVVTDELQFVNAARVSTQQILNRDDILICMANGSKALVGKAGRFMVSDDHKYTFGAFMGCFRTNSIEANPVFVFYLFLTGRYRNYVNNLLSGSSINNLRPSSIESLDFPMPPRPEQDAIAAVLSEMDAELATLEARRDKAIALKQGMMQELLTGRIRLV